MIFGSHIALIPFIVFCASFCNILACLVASYKRDRLDIFVIAHIFGDIEISVDHLQDSFGQIDLLSELAHQNGCGGSTFTRLQNESVSTSNCNGEHPQRDHSRKVERRHSSTHSQGHLIRVSVDSYLNVDVNVNVM